MTSLEELREAVETGAGVREDPFALLRDLSGHAAQSQDPAERSLVRELIIQTREQREDFPAPMRAVVDALVRELGLFPYLDHNDTLSARDLLTRETLRQTGLADERIVFHVAQAEVFARLISGDNVILSAPTSFGKSLLIDALLASGRYDNVLVVVPTLALIDETRRRLAARQTGHKIVTHPTQPLAQRNALVLTAERVLEFPDLPQLDLFVLDEFYKLGDMDERSQVLNQVFYEIRRKGVQYYLLGPNVEGLSGGVDATTRGEFIRSLDTTVALRFHTVDTSAGEGPALVELCDRLQGPTLVYCQSPDSAHRAARMLLAADASRQAVPGLASAADWVAANYHPDWVVTLALRYGIGIHHGRLPRALGQFMVTAFEDGRINLLLCTGSLIEGVNTQAQNVVLYDKRRPGNKKMDAFTFRNICGRCGRMFRHFSGDVWLMHDAPEGELPDVDIPFLSQTDEVPTSLLQQLDEADLSERSQERLKPVHDQQEISEETLKANVGLDVDAQIALARHLRADPGRYHAALSFTGTPDYKQLEVACRLIWDFLGERTLKGDYVRSPSQLTRQLSALSHLGTTKALIDEAITVQQGDELDKTIAGICGFVRSVASFAFPVRLRALDRIQREVFTAAGMTPGSYVPYISRVEGLFLPSPLLALDEYGVPPELASKLRAVLAPDGNLDAVLDRLKKIDAAALQLSAFEIEMIQFAQAGV
jgi:hypothetical protein